VLWLKGKWSVEMGQTQRVLLAALFYLLSSAYLLLLGNAAFTLRPFCVALGRLWCEYDYPRWDAHTMPICTCNTSVLAHRLLSWGRSSNLCPSLYPAPMP
jgi:hypothetical protein